MRFKSAEKVVWVFFFKFIIIIIFNTCNSIFSRHKYIFSNGMYRVASRLEEILDCVSLPDLCEPHLTREMYLSLHNHTLSTPLLRGSMHTGEFFKDEAREE